MPAGYRLNPAMQDELGFIPLAMAAAPAIGGIAKGIGGLFGKKKKKGGGAPAPAAAAKSGEPKASSALSAGLSGIPVVAAPAPKANVKADALAALKSYQTTEAANKRKHDELVKKLSAIVKPTVDKMHKDVQLAALQRKVTNEHKRKMRDEQRWADNDAHHKQIMAKFDQLESALAGSHGTTKRVFKIYGVNT